MTKAKILFINTEVEPYMPSRHLADIGRMLPQAMQDAGHEIRVFCPRFGSINERRNQLHNVIRLSGQNIRINDSDHPLVLKVATLMPHRIQIYFIENDDYYTQRNVYHDNDGNEYPDQVERCLFFARGIAETVKRLHWTPDVVYCQGWFASVIPMHFRKATGDNVNFKKAKIVYSLFNDTFKTPWPATTSSILKVDGVTKADISDIRDKEVNCTMMSKLAIKFSDGVIICGTDIDQQLIDYSNDLGKKMLDVSDQKEIVAETYSEYFNSFLPEPQQEPQID